LTATTNLPLSVYVPYSNVISESDRDLLESKLLNSITSIGYSSQGNQEQFVCYAKVVLIESQKIEGGMKTILQNKYEFNFYIKDLKTNTVFSSISKNIIGSGYSLELCAKNAISTIKTADNIFLNFITTGINRIVDFYSQNCDNIINEALNLAESNRFEEALYKLTSVPRTSDTCYQKILRQTNFITKKFVIVNCKQQLAQANSYITNNDISRGMKILAGVAGISQCEKEWIKLRNRAESLMNEQQKNSWKYLFQQQKNDLELSKARAEYAKDIAVAYYSNRPPVYNYNLIIW
jgi:hypothetical protein